MYKKRLIAVVTVRNGWAVQSFGYKRYLPIGRPEIVIENLDRWGADEILLQCIDRNLDNVLGPDFDLLARTGKLGLSTPLIYAGGIRHTKDAVKAVMLGADRVMVDALLWEHPQSVEDLASKIGSQAVIVNLPLRSEANTLIWMNYRNTKEIPLTKAALEQVPFEHISELMLTDFLNEGTRNTFDIQIARLFPIKNKSLILFGGISEFRQFKELFAIDNVSAVGVGNFLNYKEHAVQAIKQELAGAPIRVGQYEE